MVALLRPKTQTTLQTLHEALRVSCTVSALQNIFADAGVEWKWYRYFDPKTVGLDFEGLMEDIRAAPEGSIIVLHGKARPCKRILSRDMAIG